jgi:hypothetical protein
MQPKITRFGRWRSFRVVANITTSREESGRHSQKRLFCKNFGCKFGFNQKCIASLKVPVQERYLKAPIRNRDAVINDPDWTHAVADMI